MNWLLASIRSRPLLVATVLLGPAVAWIALFAIVPAATVVRDSLTSPTGGFTLAHFAVFFKHSIYSTILWRSILIGMEATLLTLLLGYPVAYYLGTRAGPGSILLLMIIIPFWTSYLIRIFAWVILLMERGVINDALLKLGVIDEPLRLLYTHLGVVVAIVYSELPFMILPIFAVISGIDRGLTEAAKNLGATEWQAFREITLPLSLPGIVVGCSFGFIFSMGSYLGPAILGGKDVIMVANTIADLYLGYSEFGLGSAISVIVIVVVIAMVAALFRTVSIEEIYGRRS